MEMKQIETIDLWTEQHPNQFECFNGAFIDGVSCNKLPYDSIKIVRNCNCEIINNKDFPISNKHQAIVFYKSSKPIRLIVACKKTDLEKLYLNSLNQEIG